jgi:putative oxygen-independent coproporphyrinogen III oxidase
MGITDADALIPLSLYVHFPWCVKKCPYCDFNSHALRGSIPEDAYVDALLSDLDWELADAAESRPLVSIFMGGGTPSLFSGHAIARLLDGLRRRLDCAADIEITLEANPGTAEAGHFRDYRAAGVNRLSMGFQSLDDAQLRRLGRVHGAAEARRAYALARAAGFDNINLDLMFALPEQTLEQADADIGALIALAPEHISYYQLTLEPNTAFALQPPPLPDGDLAWEMQAAGQARLAAAGYMQYEVSAYARAGRTSRHNLNYWRFGDYLGVGAGAHQKRSAGGKIERRARHKHPQAYLERAGRADAVQERREVVMGDRAFEYVLNALRLREGFSRTEFSERCGPASLLDAGLEEARRQGLIEESGGRVRASELGWRHLNRLVGFFL